MPERADLHKTFGNNIIRHMCLSRCQHWSVSNRLALCALDTQSVTLEGRLRQGPSTKAPWCLSPPCALDATTCPGRSPAHAPDRAEVWRSQTPARVDEA